MIVRCGVCKQEVKLVKNKVIRHLNAKGKVCPTSGREVPREGNRQ